MTIRDIVLHQGPDSRSPARLEIAVSLAKAHQARIIGVFVKVDPGVSKYWWMAFGKEKTAEWLSTLERSGAELEAAFETRMAEEGLESEWRVMDGDPSDAMLACARYGDLTVIGQTDSDEPTYGTSMPHQLVLSAGAPVLVVPYAGDFKTIGRRVLVAWNSGREAGRAVRDAMPILEQADAVLVHYINPEDGRHWAGTDVCAYLARHGVKAEASHIVLGPETKAVSSALQTVGGFGFQQRGPWAQTRHAPVGKADVGNALLSAVTDFSADLLVMGAYGHSRLRETVFGGATREILEAMTAPVLMSN